MIVPMVMPTGILIICGAIIQKRSCLLLLGSDQAKDLILQIKCLKYSPFWLLEPPFRPQNWSFKPRGDRAWLCYSLANCL